MKLKIMNKLGFMISEIELDSEKVEIICEDKFGRNWKLEQVNNPAIGLPFLLKQILTKEKE